MGEQKTLRINTQWLLNGWPDYIYIDGVEYTRQDKVAKLETARDALVQMIREAYDSMRSEHMSCPWCTYGYIGRQDEGHDEDCPWLKMLKEIKG